MTAAIASLAVLVVALNLILGSEWRVLFFHVNIAAGFMLPRKDAYAAITGLAVVTFVLGVASGLAFFALPTAALGLWATAFVRQVAAVAETSEQLRRAEEDREREAQELSAARVIQQQLLPKELPTLSGWRIAAYYQPARDRRRFLRFSRVARRPTRARRRRRHGQRHPSRARHDHDSPHLSRRRTGARLSRRGTRASQQSTVSCHPRAHVRDVPVCDA